VGIWDEDRCAMDSLLSQLDSQIEEGSVNEDWRCVSDRSCEGLLLGKSDVSLLRMEAVSPEIGP